MTNNTLNPLTSASEVITPSRRIVELPMRLFHTFMAISFAGAYITAESERFRLLHVSLGYTLFGLVVFRVLWGMMGPRQSRRSAPSAMGPMRPPWQNLNWTKKNTKKKN